MNFRLLLLLLFLFCSSCAVFKSKTASIDKIFNEAETFKHGFSGFVVYNPATQQTLYSKNAHKYFIPASNTKLITFYASLKILGDSIPSITYKENKDYLIFSGTGDPSLLYKDFNSNRVIDFLKNSTKKLVLKPKYVTTKRFGSGWAWDDYNDDYSAERSAFPIYGNRVSFQLKKEAKLPIIYPNIFSDSTVVSTEINQPILRKEKQNIFQYKNVVENYQKEIPFITSEKTTATLLSDTLRKEVLNYDDIFENKNPIELTDTIYSVAATSLYKTMLQESDNFIAEQLLMLCADKLNKNYNSKAAINTIKKMLFTYFSDPFYWYDGSGLSRYNLCTPQSLVDLITEIVNEIGTDNFKKVLPAGGESGSLKNYYIADKPYIYAKTGSLRNNHSLSGLLLTKSGKTLYFSFMNSNYTISSSQLKQTMEEILKTVRDQY
ncbi:D-alanyl-D-alanine carboxypeptidase/D-alanyl-D-alanine-endopeptidase [Zunongwangia sp.]|uniref:D-alanyl-D-alanine carboxypeptidase/D-alanyl-D-alanine endopeptidase n=1 Tax=Zunongwangia sp. TaxID=1965325 RepID=UPI003AA99CE6